MLVDRADVIEEGKHVIGWKAVTGNEEFFQGHFPENPVMPGVLILEAMAQTGGCLVFAANPDYKGTKLMYLTGIEKARFRRPVVPGDQLVMTLQVVAARPSFVKVSGEARVDGALCAEAELLCTLVDLPKGMAF